LCLLHIACSDPAGEEYFPSILDEMIGTGAFTGLALLVTRSRGLRRLGMWGGEIGH
jgi:hypothetical protein